MQKQHKKTSSNLESVISQRLKLNTNQRILEDDFQVPFLTLNKIKTSNLLKRDYFNWSEEKRNKFILTLGGRVNFQQTKEYLENIFQN